jgi:HEAT repeats
MSIPSLRRGAAWSAWVCLLGLAADPLSADVVTLKQGGAVQGKVVTSRDPNAVALQTAKGALIVFDRSDVKSVQRGQNTAQKTAQKTPAKSPPKKPAAAKKQQLTPQEKTWMAKVHSLIERANGSDPDRRRKAISDLLNVSDESAIPALTRYLAASSNEREREFYAKILQNIRGPKAVYCLVRQSIVDPSAAVREAARKAIGAERADLARPLYIEILKLRDPVLSSVAAKGIGEIGDPNGESVPYLIDAVVIQTARFVVTSQAQVFDADRLAEISYQNWLNAQAQTAANAPPAPPPPKMQIRVGENVMGSVQSMGGSPLGYANVTIPPLEGPMFPPMFGAHNPPQQKFNGVTTHVTLGDVLNTPVRYSMGIASEKNVNPAVYDTLVQLTGQQFGSNLPNWRRFWANQQKNRALKSPKTPDRVISKSSTP